MNHPHTLAELYDWLHRLTNEIDGIAHRLQKMTPIRFPCPHCGKENMVDRAFAGKPGWCMH